MFSDLFFSFFFFQMNLTTDFAAQILAKSLFVSRIGSRLVFMFCCWLCWCIWSVLALNINTQFKSHLRVRVCVYLYDLESAQINVIFVFLFVCCFKAIQLDTKMALIVSRSPTPHHLDATAKEMLRSVKSNSFNYKLQPPTIKRIAPPASHNTAPTPTLPPSQLPPLCHTISVA